MFQTIRLDHAERVSTITINRPPLNTVSPRALDELLAAFDELARRDETRCVVLTGSGTRAFCAGANLDEKPKGEGDPSTAFREAGRALVDRIETFPKPVIAAIRGWCIGGGFAIAESCDVRIASESAKFRTGDAYLGIVPSWGMSLVRLCHYIGRNRALDMLILGEDIGAAEAQELGSGEPRRAGGEIRRRDRRDRRACFDRRAPGVPLDQGGDLRPVCGRHRCRARTSRPTGPRRRRGRTTTTRGSPPSRRSGSRASRGADLGFRA